jgi:hypothetical protein
MESVAKNPEGSFMGSVYINKNILSSALITALLSLSACGEKKEVHPVKGDGPVQEAPKTTTTVGEQDPDSNKKPDTPDTQDKPTNPNDANSKGANGGGGLPPPPGPSNPDHKPDQKPRKKPRPKKDAPNDPNTPIPAPDDNSNGQNDPNIPIPAPNPNTGNDPNIPIPAPNPNTGNDPNVPIPAPPAPPVKNPPRQSDSDNGYDAKDPRNVESSRFPKRYTGLKTQEGLAYTGGGPDSLLTYLRQRAQDPSVDAQSRTRNLEAARNVISARISRSARDISINLELAEGGSTKMYVLEGRLNEERVTGLRVSDANGSQNVEGSLKCMDTGRSCEVSMAKILIGRAPNRGVVRIVFRDSIANVHVDLPNYSSGNPEYETLKNFWFNSARHAGSNNKIKEVYMNSFEVVNGRAGFDVQVVGENRQNMVFAGPLLAPMNGTAVNIRADRSVDTEDAKYYDYDYNSSIGSARIVNNNGLGQLKLSLKMRARGNYNQDIFTLTVMRSPQRILPLTEENIKL